MTRKIAFYRHDVSGELVTPHRIGEDDSGRSLYHAPEGFTPVDSEGIEVPVECDSDGNWIPV